MTLATYRGVAVVLLILGVAFPAHSQDERGAEVSVGYQMLTLRQDDSETLGRGWYADVAANVGPNFAVVVQVGGNYETVDNVRTFDEFTGSVTADLTLHQVLGGVRVSLRSTAISPYVEVLAGGVKGTADSERSVTSGGHLRLFGGLSHSYTDVAVQFGGGVTIWLSRRVGLRGALAYMHVLGEDTGVNIVRAAGGITFGF